MFGIRPPMKHSFIPLAVTLALMLFLSACGAAAEKPKSALPGMEPIPVKLTPIEQVNSQRPIEVGGLLGTENDARLSFKTGGIIQRIHVKVGDPVRRGQLLATLDMTEITAAVKQAQLGVDKAQRDLDRVTALHRDSVATLEMLQNAQTGLDFAKQTLASAQFNATHSEIRSTADGFVLARVMNEGELAGPGMPVLAISATSGQSQWVLKAGLADREWSLLQVDDSATVQLDAYPGQTFQGRMTRKSLGADPYSGSFQVEIALDLGKTKPAAGLFGHATIYPSAKAQYWLLPYEAVLEANGDDAFVFVTSDRKVARKVPVKVAYLDNDKIAIAGGLEGYPAVITTGSAYLTDNSPITVAQ
jgi:multidrug efflux system membrane fusion protein